MKRIEKKELEVVVLMFLILFAFKYLFINNYRDAGPEPHFSFLADSFLHGKTYLLEYPENHPSSLTDVVSWGNRYYWPEGPFPAVLLMPFVLMSGIFGVLFHQAYLQFFLTILVFLVFFRLGRKLGYSVLESWYIAAAFCFGSMFIGTALVGMSWYFSQITAVLLFSLALLEYFGKKRWWLIGTLFGLLLLTRMTAALGIIFFILDILPGDPSRKKKLLVSLLVPVLASFCLLAAYNYARFNNPFEQGYSVCALGDPNDGTVNALEANRALGLFSPIHLPANLYHMLLAGPQPVFGEGGSHILEFPYFKLNPWGMSIFMTSPWLIYLFFLSYRDGFSKRSWLAIVLIALPIIFYYGIGYVQFGYRYALDFMPLMSVLLFKNYREQRGQLSRTFKALIIVSAAFNFYLLLPYII